MTGGYLVEKEFRRAMAPRTWNRVLTPISVVAFAMTLMMAVLGLSPGSDESSLEAPGASRKAR
jgi:hypothetical protein